jgi:DNA-binding NarL/FixJ family response regulator
MQHPTTVALVDDHGLLRTGLAGLIDSFPEYRVVIQADNGREFVQICRPDAPPDLILLDITMPLMNGYETAKWIQAHLPLAKVLVLSMMDNDSAVIRMMQCGARGYILKDCKPNVLKAALDQVRDHGYFINDLVSNRMIKFLHGGEGKNASEPAPVLSEREMTFLKLICTEKTYKEIAAEMYVSPRTVESYRDNLFQKLGVTSRVGLVIYAIKTGIAAV